MPNIMNQTFRTKASTNLFQSSRSNMSYNQNRSNMKAETTNRVFSPPSISSSKTKKSRIDFQSKLQEIYNEEQGKQWLSDF